jgi:hypothetical protein
MTRPLFKLGRTLITPGARRAIADCGDDPDVFLFRHMTGDWGTVCDEDVKENEYSLNRHLRLFSAYELANGKRLWVITEADRSATTLLLPSEY